MHTGLHYMESKLNYGDLILFTRSFGKFCTFRYLRFAVCCEFNSLKNKIRTTLLRKCSEEGDVKGETVEW